MDAVNNCKDLQIQFPKSHAEQEKIAAAFKQKSSANFDNCVGCIDCMLVWTNKPSKPVLDTAELGSKRFFCGRKKKFGMVLQAVCDHHRRFIHIDISQPASTSDYLTFCTSHLLNHQLLKYGFLKPGLTLFGDNAYVNTEFMTTPFKAVSGGELDAFNYYHLQVRINIECAFGMLIHRWGCLRKALPVNLSIERISALVKCLCILHNFCINERLNNAMEVHNCVPTTVADSTSIMVDGGEMNTNLDTNNCSISIQHDEVGNITTNESFDSLYHIGHHYDDCPTTRIRLEMASRQFRGNTLPRVDMLNHLQTIGYTKRPKPMGSTSTNNNYRINNKIKLKIK